MMSSSSKPSTTGLKIPRRSRSRGLNQYLILGAVGAAVIIVLVVVLSSVRKPAPAPAKAKTKSADVAQPRPERSREVRTTRSVRASVSDRRAAREQRRARERAARAASRSAGSGSYTASGRRSSRSSGVPVLSTILETPQGSRVAVFGARSVKDGEQIDGRQILEVDADKVRIQFRNETYEVKIGQPLYSQ